jgi:hypothetical protein
MADEGSASRSFRSLFSQRHKTGAKGFFSGLFSRGD